MCEIKISDKDKKVIEKSIHQLVNRYSKILIYPFGNIGKYAKKYFVERINVNDYKVYAGDNYNYGNGVLSGEEIPDFLKENDDVAILFATQNAGFYHDVQWKKYRDCKDRLFFMGDSIRMKIQVDSLINQEYESSMEKKRKDLVSFFREKPIQMQADDVFAGGIKNVPKLDMLPNNTHEEVNNIKKRTGIDFQGIIDWEQEGIICRNPGNHMIPDYEGVLKRGLKYYYTKLLSKRDSREEYVVALQTLIQRYGEAASKENIEFGEKIRNACKQIVQESPEHLYDAIQLLIFLHETVVDEAGCGSISFGRLDQYLYPFYKKDKKDGMITDEEAQIYINALWRKFAENEMSWQNVTLGGRIYDDAGVWHDGCNELTVMMLEASRVVRSDQPQISLRDSGEMPQMVWEKAMEILSLGGGIPSIFSDEIAIQAKKQVGVVDEDARNYGVMGCVELCIPGKEYSHAEGMRINLAKILEKTLHNVMQNNDFDKYKCFDLFLQDYLRTVKKVILYISEYIEVARNEYGKQWQVPYTSIFMQNCIESGRDVTDEGTIYNFSTICPVGFATTVDSLEAIREVVFEKKQINLSEVYKNLCQNLENEVLRNQLLECEKYGNDLVKPDEIAQILTNSIFEAVKEASALYGRNIQLGYYTSYFHSDFGKKTGATADGRKRGLPLSPSYSAMSGMDKNGPLALMNSATKMDMTGFSNGMALDVRFTKGFLQNKENQVRLISAIRGYFAKGGMEIQINCFDNEELMDAQKHPENHRNLVVRVAGFSAYFINLDRELQDEIIKRNANEAL